ncbi:hypothetical protein M422DRAFT_252992 [Sphaerobolus stellatus SS14]|uniref:Uncharacterized protein n=1 Tax=Sphaerobolus stellatus (strain SS14) TaxID=990650 RepID=A0A0C9V9U4_SPHS4|nr:hypothetical protein M422DRAFT_252992 [Sphaerobolus stellatus SS14]
MHEDGVYPTPEFEAALQETILVSAIEETPTLHFSINIVLEEEVFHLPLETDSWAYHLQTRHEVDFITEKESRRRWRNIIEEHL